MILAKLMATLEIRQIAAAARVNVSSQRTPLSTVSIMAWFRRCRFPDRNPAAKHQFPVIAFLFSQPTAAWSYWCGPPAVTLVDRRATDNENRCLSGALCRRRDPPIRRAQLRVFP